MTRVGVFSDSHGDERALTQLLEQMGYIDAACFLGDVDADAEHLRLLLAQRPNRPPLYAVRGNNDYYSERPYDLLVELGGKRLFLTHGHRYGGPMSLSLLGAQMGVQAVLFGHTHVPMCEYDRGVLLLNPGSAGNYCRGGRARASLLVIDGNEMRVQDVRL